MSGRGEGVHELTPRSRVTVGAPSGLDNSARSPSHPGRAVPTVENCQLIPCLNGGGKACRHRLDRIENQRLREHQTCKEGDSPLGGESPSCDGRGNGGESARTTCPTATATRGSASGGMRGASCCATTSPTTTPTSASSRSPAPAPTAAATKPPAMATRASACGSPARRRYGMEEACREAVVVARQRP